MESIADVESGWKYNARWPRVVSWKYQGERALWKYQVMPSNLPQWSQEAIGRGVTDEYYMNNSYIQDAIAKFQILKIFDKYGNWDDVASVWYSGKPLNKAQKRSDGYMWTSNYVFEVKSKMHSKLENP